MVKFNKETKIQLIELYNTKNITLEGNITKVIDVENDDADEAVTRVDEANVFCS